MAIIIYVLAICASNLLVATFGPSVTPINAFFLIAMDMTLRDKLHDKWGSNVPKRMPALILSAGLISYFANPETGVIAVASFIAFSMSSVSDSVTYHAMREKPWVIKSNVSNVIGSAVDSIVFPFIAFGVLIPEIIFWQFIAKVVGGFLWACAFSLLANKFGREVSA